MLDRIFLALTNALYFIPFQIRRFKQKFPESRVIIACATKARKLKENQDPQYEYGWSLARRGMLILTETHLYCGDWEIPINSIREAVLYKILYGVLLKIETTDRLHYQFGMQNEPAWENQRFLPLKVVRKVLKFSIPALVMRIIVSALLLWLIFQNVLASEITFFTIIYFMLVIYVLFPIYKWLISQSS